MAELGRDLFTQASRVAPEACGFDTDLSQAWQRIGKVRWSLGLRDQALAAFWESADLQKRVFQREPSNHTNRKDLSRCYDRLVHFSSRGGDLPGAAAAILERTKLWPGDANQRAQSAKDFDELAERVAARARGPLSREDRAERDHYLAESRRVRLDTKAAVGR
jgi:hypothetical protein